MKVKARVMAHGFQDNEIMQADSPSVLKDQIKTMFAIAANNGHEIASVDITRAFIQGKNFDREVFIQPPTDKKNQT